ncbi:hypothetical protein T10_1041, partial [Trichinella papuae]
MAPGFDVMERPMFSASIFLRTTSVAFGVSEFTVTATVSAMQCVGAWGDFSQKMKIKRTTTSTGLAQMI